MDRKETEKQITGRIGEQEAGFYLIKQGFKVVDRNYRKKYGEIDLVATKGNDLVFVEVKTVTRWNLGQATLGGGEDGYSPEDNTHPWKLKRLSRAIQVYLLEKNVSDEIDWRLDSIAVYLTPAGEVLKVEHLEDIF